MRRCYSNERSIFERVFSRFRNDVMIRCVTAAGGPQIDKETSCCRSCVVLTVAVSSLGLNIWRCFGFTLLTNSHTFSDAGRLLEGFVSRILRSHRTETERLTDSSLTDRRGRFCLKWETVLYLRFIFQLKWRTVHDDSHTHTHTQRGTSCSEHTGVLLCE